MKNQRKGERKDEESLYNLTRHILCIEFARKCPYSVSDDIKSPD
uniref:Uncharacterized protein n=1 Tax=Rhizophora mucronata TaxID=61149 RepID=A0A2P2N6S5_RHIMU